MQRYDNLRINLFFILVTVISSLIIYRLFIVSVVRHSSYLRTAQTQSENIHNILARGNIYLSDKDAARFLASMNKKFPLAYIVSSDIKSDKEEAVKNISQVLQIDENIVREKINSGSNKVRVLARKITTEQVQAIKNLNIKGVNVSYETDRFYPGGNLAANIIGFLGYDAEGKRAGQYGVESYYDRELFGKREDPEKLLISATAFKFLQSVKNLVLGYGQNKNPASEQEFDKPVDIVLTVDKNVQTFIEEKLKVVMEKWQAESGVIIVQEPQTGKILAMADWPSFDPNNYADIKSEYFLNSSTQEIYEPGSSFKPVTMSAGIDLGKVMPQTSYEDIGFVNVAGYTIKNFSEKVFGRQTMSQVLEKSINTGVMFVENLIGDDNFLNYVINMGFGQKTGIDLPGEVSGDVTNLYSGRKINYLTASFGQGIAVTPIQLINAYSAIANGGKLMRPYVADKIIREGGQEEITQSEILSIPISERTSLGLRSMLVSVVDNGFDKAKIKGYDVAGKTGTAQMPDGKGGYSEDQFIHNFVGFAPAYNAKFVVLIKMDKPRGIQFAADSLSPVFRDIAWFLLNYYNILPTRQ